MMRLKILAICLCLFACSRNSGEKRNKDLPSTEKKDPYETLFGESLIRGINFSVSVDSLSHWPKLRELDHNTFIIVDTTELFLEETHIHHNDQYIQRIETWIDPTEGDVQALYDQVNSTLTTKYGSGQGEAPYKVWILDHKGKPLIELSLEVLEGKDSNRLKVSCFLRQYI